MLDTLPELATKAMNIVRLQALQVKVTELDEYGNVVMRPDLLLPLTPSHRNRPLLFPVAG